MISRRLLAVAAAVTLAAGLGGGVVAAGLAQAPAQDATPAPAGDPVGDLLRNAPAAAPVEAAPAGAPAPAAPIAITPVGPLETAPTEDEAAATDDDEAPAQAVAEKVEEPDTPLPRQRRRVALVEAIDKITAERMRFEVEVGGRPVRFNNALIFSARACEVAADNELVQDAIAYLDISLQPRGTATASEPRQIFRGWMFASTPGVSGLQHPIYDAWVVGCKA